MPDKKRWRWDWWLAWAAYAVSFGGTVLGGIYLLSQWSACITVGRAVLYLVAGILAIAVCAITREWSDEVDRRYARATPKADRSSSPVTERQG